MSLLIESTRLLLITSSLLFGLDLLEDLCNIPQLLNFGSRRQIEYLQCDWQLVISGETFEAGMMIAVLDLAIECRHRFCRAKESNRNSCCRSEHAEEGDFGFISSNARHAPI